MIFTTSPAPPGKLRLANPPCRPPAGPTWREGSQAYPDIDPLSGRRDRDVRTLLLATMDTVVDGLAEYLNAQPHPHFGRAVVCLAALELGRLAGDIGADEPSLATPARGEALRARAAAVLVFHALDSAGIRPVPDHLPPGWARLGIYHEFLWADLDRLVRDEVRRLTECEGVPKGRVLQALAEATGEAAFRATRWCCQCPHRPPDHLEDLLRSALTYTHVGLAGRPPYSPIAYQPPPPRPGR